ncbi:MAG: ATP-binding protein [Clostridiales Family XIII bacterium]|jgi:anti-sigma regulatory factor (Ser/Thr protein kinase)|nr:ATP-binding protein [Clostridiales Family XIII bacterium]
MRELSLNILDIAENSVKAGAKLVRVTVEAVPAEDSLVLTVCDDGSGMDAEMAARAADPFSTTRTTRKVGLGLPYLKMNAGMTGGSMEIESEAGKGTKVTATFVLGHIDRVPLGDMGQTMALLAGANPEMDFVYELCVRGAEDEDFILDTRDIKRILDGVPVSEPDVMTYIASYVNENTRGLLEKYKI